MRTFSVSGRASASASRASALFGATAGPASSAQRARSSGVAAASTEAPPLLTDVSQPRPVRARFE
eukprot:1141271-Prymnesium_polylepis.1